MREISNTKPYIFVSYSAKDYGKVEEIVQRIREEGYEVYFEKKNRRYTRG